MQVRREWRPMWSRGRVRDRKVPGHFHVLPQRLEELIWGGFHEKLGMRTDIGFSCRECSVSKLNPRESADCRTSAHSFNSAGRIRDTEPRHACIVRHQGV
ncbi:hypothetical protein ASPBRDRAFT_289226 [Aspergillus brasiliensis CBS 101740]|uniref:Uncharacterized protein n=1 Tax=Aspergillus brasiliensis (strain CBS 101740 / IMI 381727 / IBT 21946) TaxID=767769 RepID=A0A1L9UB53_ASPBC|nr:hypothetical protein ASPBRDRAFT_289226 [Aspergillus brasiliensis CBS 101740]